MCDRYYLEFSAAFVRGRAILQGQPPVPPELAATPLDDLTPRQLNALHALGERAGLRLHRFKRTVGLARVQRVLGVLRSIQPANILDIGSGRGTFLWPLLAAFPDLPVMAIDRNPLRGADLQAVALGGIKQLSARTLDATHLDFKDSTFDVVTVLEVLEHITNAQHALEETCRVARRFVILTVPSKEDNNPEHIHLFSQPLLREMFQAVGVTKVNFDYVPGHLVAVANASTSS